VIASSETGDGTPSRIVQVTPPSVVVAIAPLGASPAPMAPAASP